MLKLNLFLFSSLLTLSFILRVKSHTSLEYHTQVSLDLCETLGKCFVA